MILTAGFFNALVHHPEKTGELGSLLQLIQLKVTVEKYGKNKFEEKSS